MAYNNLYNQVETYIAGADLSAGQYLFVTSDGDEVSVAGNGDAAIGVLLNNPVAADAASVATGGEPNVYVGTGGLAIGNEVASDADGKAVVAASTDVILGVARTAAAAGGLAMITFYKPAQAVKA